MQITKCWNCQSKIKLGWWKYIMETASVVVEAAKICNFENKVFCCQELSKLVMEGQNQGNKVLGMRLHFFSQTPHNPMVWNNFIK